MCGEWFLCLLSCFLLNLCVDTFLIYLKSLHTKKQWNELSTYKDVVLLFFYLWQIKILMYNCMCFGCGANVSNCSHDWIRKRNNSSGSFSETRNDNLADLTWVWIELIFRRKIESDQNSELVKHWVNINVYNLRTT